MNVVKNLWQNGVLPKIIGVLILIALSGIAPRPHEIQEGFERARQAQSEHSLQAVEQLSWLAERLPWRTDLWEQAAAAAYVAGDYEQTIELSNQATRLSPAGRIIFGDAFHQIGEFDQAIHAWKILLEEHDPSEDVLIRLSDAYLALGDYNLAINNLKALLELQTQIPNDQYPISQTYHKLGILLAAHNPLSAPPYLLQAAELDASHRTQLRDLAFAIQRSLSKNETAFTLLEVGRILAQQYHWGLAAHAFQQATQLRPDYAEAWAYLGEAYQQIDNPNSETALEMLERAISLDPDSLAANTFQAIYWQRHGDHQLAQGFIQASAALDEHNPTLQIYLAEISAQMGAIQIARDFYEKAIQLDPYDAATYQSLAEFCLRYNLDLQNLALPAARRAVLLAPNDPASLDVMGQVLFSSGDHQNAERFYLRALSQDANYARAHLHLGLIFLLEGDGASAYERFSLVLSLAPNTPSAEHAQRLLDESFNQ